MITASEAQRLFDTLRGVLREGERLLVEIIESRAWEPLGYPSLAAAWDQEIGPDVILLTKKAKQAVLREMVESGTTAAMPRIRGLGGSAVERFLSQYHSGIPVDRIDINQDFWGEELLEILGADAPPKGWNEDWWWRARENFYLHEQTPRGGRVKWVDRKTGNAKRRGKRDGVLEEIRVRRRATTAALPSKPTTVHVVLGEADYERMSRVLSASGKFQNDELKRVIMAHIDRLEADLLVSV